MESSIAKLLTLSNGKINIERIAFVTLYASMLAVFINNGLCIVLGPVMAALMCYLFLKGHSEEIFAIIIVANDALGTMFGGKISFPYLLLVLVIVKAFYKNAFTLREYCFGIVAICLSVQLYLMDDITLRQLIYSAIFILAIISVRAKRETLDAFMRGVAMTVVVIALHACITGGVEFYEQNIYSQEFLRRGILGVGIGDSNYSSFLLNIGIICIWCDDKISRWVKLACVIPILYAMTLTLSASGLLMFLIILVFGILLGKNKPKAIVVLLTAVIFILTVSFIYVNLPNDMRIESVDAYIDRMEGKIDSLNEGDYDSFTTGRTGLTERYIEYFSTQGIGRYFFGGNKLMAVGDSFSHNTYVDFLIRFGLIGAFAFFAFVAIAFYKTVKGYAVDISKKRSILLKVLCLFVATNLTLIEGSLWAMWMYFLFMV